MPEYRFYKIRRDGHIGEPPINRTLADDLAAVREANNIVGVNDIEVWQGPRVVAYVMADSTAKKAS